MIKLDLLTQIAFGNKEYVKQLLEVAKEDLQTADEKLLAAEANDAAGLFDELHRLKTTLSMLQAGPMIVSCQALIDQIDEASSTVMSDQLNTFRIKLKALTTELDTLIIES